jgi:hypothetical protein
MRAAFLALGVGTLATAANLGLSCGLSAAWRRVGVLMLVGAALGAFLDAGFDTDRLGVSATADGTVHGVGAAIFVLALPGAAFVLGAGFIRNSISTPRARLLLILGAVQLGAVVLFDLSPVTFRGWTERLVAVLAVATLGLLQVLSRANEWTGRARSVAQGPVKRDQSSVFRGLFT